ncbi:TPA: NAD(P)-dependent oxidoreductase [Streptococcus suis]|uniref:Putative NADH-flavin reductase n=1 Tax=Streptococcus suis TaxID=1307 RepID=A0A0Z8KVW5_STRSU|nr:NAD(P)-dependent oxidoreductase [Streptococcus suis]AXI64829.1 NAD(P)-dependent oxidoreductase [Streptococcus suis]MBO8111585.1 NAD(P)-dependent oxidoreductase [Streptococcus suis]MBS8090258.1 NAD(P)-dependent oxidoreductase [Streptococcus suis]MCB2852195.1 NAD(P)-dependent oxidoreductase [Streptococcus suis]MCB2858036.1 NAD(P)-dependent oxidoreductase [Streptococcus suis]
MKIAVVAANGKAGSLIVKEAVARGFEVTAIVRGENKTVAQQVLQKDVFDLTADDVIGFDAVVDAVGAWTADTVHMVPDAAKHLATILKDSQTRLLVVGGAASLYVNPERTLTVADVTEFPAEVLPVLNAHKEALEALRQVDDVNWTYVSPAGDFQADGERTGRYILGGEELVLNSKGESVISYADYAIGMIDEIATGDHLKAHISLVSE